MTYRSMKTRRIVVGIGLLIGLLTLPSQADHRERDRGNPRDVRNHAHQALHKQTHRESKAFHRQTQRQHRAFHAQRFTPAQHRAFHRQEQQQRTNFRIDQQQRHQSFHDRQRSHLQTRWRIRQTTFSPVRWWYW